MLSFKRHCGQPGQPLFAVGPLRVRSRRAIERVVSEAIRSVRTLDCFAAALLAMTMFASVGKPAHAESIKIGISKLIGYPGVPIAVERGYFKEQGIDAAPIRSRGINRKAS
jgi:hypothetical protein